MAENEGEKASYSFLICNLKQPIELNRNSELGPVQNILRVSYGKLWTDKTEQLEKNVLIFSKYEKNSRAFHLDFEVISSFLI